MPDAFFASKKRKRSTGTKRQSRPPFKPNEAQSKSKRKKPCPDEELNSDGTDHDDGAIDDLDLRAHDEPESSGNEDIDETPAEKRLRLAKFYLQSVTDGLGELVCVRANPPSLTSVQPKGNSMLPRSTKSSYPHAFAKTCSSILEKSIYSLRTL